MEKLHPYCNACGWRKGGFCEIRTSCGPETIRITIKRADTGMEMIFCLCPSEAKQLVSNIVTWLPLAMLDDMGITLED